MVNVVTLVAVVMVVSVNVEFSVYGYTDFSGFNGNGQSRV